MKPPDDPTKLAGKDGLALLFSHVGGFFLDGLLLMLAVGVLHASAHAIPAFGYWQCAFVAWVFAGIAATGNSSIILKLKKLGLLVQAQTAAGALSSAISDYLKSVKS